MDFVRSTIIVPVAIEPSLFTEISSSPLNVRIAVFAKSRPETVFISIEIPLTVKIFPFISNSESSVVSIVKALLSPLKTIFSMFAKVVVTPLYSIVEPSDAITKVPFPVKVKVSFEASALKSISKPDASIFSIPTPAFKVASTVEAVN